MIGDLNVAHFNQYVNKIIPLISRASEREMKWKVDISNTSRKKTRSNAAYVDFSIDPNIFFHPKLNENAQCTPSRDNYLHDRKKLLPLPSAAAVCI